MSALFVRPTAWCVSRHRALSSRAVLMCFSHPPSDYNSLLVYIDTGVRIATKLGQIGLKLDKLNKRVFVSDLIQNILKIWSEKILHIIVSHLETIWLILGLNLRNPPLGSVLWGTGIKCINAETSGHSTRLTWCIFSQVRYKVDGLSVPGLLKIDNLYLTWIYLLKNTDIKSRIIIISPNHVYVDYKTRSL